MTLATTYPQLNASKANGVVKFLPNLLNKFTKIGTRYAMYVITTKNNYLTDASSRCSIKFSDSK